ncbi:MAG: hypothetical protein LBI29_00110 [Rickettsiales bacterium]|jgi:peptidoglycan L-alanyl-D-glutamate endopeptidase CwlK|nr:hypothetical protein [Rickettsiales bacterium]
MNGGSRHFFGAKSEQILTSVIPELDLLAHKVISLSPVDFAVVEGLRTTKRQKMLYNSGKSKTLNSKHCEGKALDIVPWLDNDCDYEAVSDCCFLVGLFYGVAKTLGLDLRVGALWDGNSIKNNRFVDVWHIETL